MSPMEGPASSSGTENSPPLLEVSYDYSPLFPQILEHLNASLLVTTYQAGKVVILGTSQGKLTVSIRNFDRPMGVAISDQAIAIGTRRQVQFLSPADELAPTLSPAGSLDRCWVPRSSFYTGGIHGHELAWGQDGLWVVNTLFSCLCTLHEKFNFVPRWRPKFISQLIDQDRCHLNGLALQDGQPKYVTVMAESDVAAGWRPTKAYSGGIIDVPTGETVARGLAMPHSPRLYQQRLWALNSGRGEFVSIEPDSGRVEPIVSVPGYTRGLAFHGQFAFIGLSRIRETSVFGGIPIAEKRDELRCGVAVVDLISGQAVAKFEFRNGVEEVFAVDVLPQTRNPALFGFTPEEDQAHEIWIVPQPGHIPAAIEGKGVFAQSCSDAKQTPTRDRPSRVGIGSIHDATFAAGRIEPAGATTPVKSSEQARSLAAQATSLQQQGRISEAISALRQAVALAADPSIDLTNLGNLYQEAGDQDRALDCYREAIQKSPVCVPALQNLGYLLFNRGESIRAMECYDQALKVSPTPMNRLLAATVLPVIYESQSDVVQWRQRLEARLQGLLDDGIQIDATRQMVPTSFFLAYQGLNDRDVMTSLGRLYQGDTSVEPGKRRVRRNRPRIGFLSAYFRDHTIGRLNLGRIQHLSRDQFEVAVLYAGAQADSVAEQYRSAADLYLGLPRDMAAARRQIIDMDLDMLIFADVGMDALSSTLAHSRLAPVQCATWGHPDTTGSRQMDYFLSSSLLEVDEADQHYSERLVRLPNLATWFERPQRTGPSRTKESFGLKSTRRMYLCPQTLFKFHPEFDAVLCGILERDPQGDIVLLEGRVPNWTEQLKSRFRRTLPDVDRRVLFLPAQPRQDFLALLEIADVVLDPLHFGGGHTTYEALAMGTPVVTLPGKFLRSRITQALYRRMGLESLTVQSVANYVDLAVRLATDKDLNCETRNAILGSNSVLFENPQDIRSLEEFFASCF